MGYACPVCGDPQADADHLANHLAFTALIRGGDHEVWLDEHVPDWETHDEASLGERVARDAEETEFPQVFEDTTGGQTADDHAHGHPSEGQPPGDTRTQMDDGALSEDTADVLAEARELTRKRHENSETE
ncbi:MAG: DUF5810 domain-containing protein [Haloarculaceae archaeon]